MKTFYIILLVVLILYVVIYLISKPFINPYLCIGYIGRKGSGKTTQLTKLAINYQKKGKIVYCTERIVGTRYFNPKEIGLYDFEPNSVILIDEIGIVFPARDYKNFTFNARAWFKLQRHKKCIVIWFTQTWIDCDKSIRDLTDRLYLCHNFFNMWSTYRKVEKILTIGTQKNEDGTQGNQGSDFIEVFKFSFLLAPGSLQFTFIPRWIFFYNSYSNDALEPIEYEYIPVQEFNRKFYNNNYARKYFWLTLFERIKRFIKKHFNNLKLKIKGLFLKIKSAISFKIQKIKYKIKNRDNLNEIEDNDITKKIESKQAQLDQIEKNIKTITNLNCKYCNHECNYEKRCIFHDTLERYQYEEDSLYLEIITLQEELRRYIG